MDPSSQVGSAVLMVAIVCTLLAAAVSVGCLAVWEWKDWGVPGVSARVRQGLLALVLSFAALSVVCLIAACSQFDWSDYFIIGTAVSLATYWFPRGERVPAPPRTAAPSHRDR